MIWDPDPVAFAVEGTNGVRHYAMLVLLGWAVAILAAAHAGEHRGIAPRRVTAMLVWGGLGGIIGGHLMHIACYEPDSLGDVVRLISIGSGQSSHGAIAGGIIAVAVYARTQDDEPFRYLDAAMSGAVFLIPFQRLANFANSEIVGRAWDGPWAVVFPRHDCLTYGLFGSTEICEAAVPRHPFPLYGALVGSGLISLGRARTRVRGSLR